MPALANKKHEEFAQLVATGTSAAEAYRIALGGKGQTAEVNSCRLRKQAKVLLRISEIEAGYRTHCEEQAAKSIQKKYLTLDRKRELLMLIAETPIGEIDERSPLCQSYKIGEKGDREYKMPDKLRSIELDAKLAKELVEQVNATVDTGKIIPKDKRQELLAAAIARRTHALPSGQG